MSEEKREGEDLSRTMGNGVVLEFGGGKEFGPLVGVFGTEDMEISLYFLIGSFSLSISLRMIGSGEADIVFEDSGKFFSECRGKLWSSVGDESIVKSKVFEYVVKKESGNTVRVYGF